MPSILNQNTTYYKKETQLSLRCVKIKLVLRYETEIKV